MEAGEEKEKLSRLVKRAREIKRPGRRGVEYDCGEKENQGKIDRIGIGRICAFMADG